MPLFSGPLKKRVALTEVKVSVRGIVTDSSLVAGAYRAMVSVTGGLVVAP